ncbi:hypothetical protein R4B61_00785 [Fructilactobacillus vespulae]|uniref:hypothetical protein n=1 Tax=Fructilactobacillus vespulae TaxID=1249630 RepID=UPI0039B543A2
MNEFLKIPENESKNIKNLDEILTVKLNLGGVEAGKSRKTLKIGSTKYYKRKSGQFIYGKQNFFNGGFGIIPSNLNGRVSSGDVPSFDILNIDKLFLLNLLSRKDYFKSKERFSTGTGSKRIHEKTFLNFKVNSSNNIKEQQKISKLIQKISQLITANERNEKSDSFKITI